MAQSKAGKNTIPSVRAAFSMVNQYLRALQDKGLIRFVPVGNKGYAYEPTEEGAALRRSMFAAYSGELVRLYSALKRCIQEKVSGLAAQGIRKIALFGASETCEVVLSALAESHFDVVAVVDNDTQKQGTMFKGHAVCAPEVLSYLPIQAVVITSFGHQDEIFTQLAPLASDKGMRIRIVFSPRETNRRLRAGGPTRARRRNRFHIASFRSTSARPASAAPAPAPPGRTAAWGRDRTCQKASRKSVFSGPWPTPATDVFEEGRGAARFFYTSCRRDRPSPPRKHHRASDTLPQFDGTLTIREDSRTFSVSGRGVSPAADRRQASLFSPSTKESRVAHGHDRTA